MKIAVDTNRIIAALIKDSVSRRIIFSTKFECVGVQFSRLEVKKHEKFLLQKIGQTEQEFALLAETVFSKIRLLDENEIEKKAVRLAHKIMKPIDETDTPFLALALQEQCAIWSDDKHFLRQKKAKVWTTRQLVKLL